MDLTQYDVIVISTSAGKDSQATLDTVCRLADEQGVPRARIVAVHADLGRVEWEGTPELAEKQAECYDLRFIKVSRPQGDLLDHIESRGKFPSSAARYCTSDHKRGQVDKVFTQLVRELDLGRPARILHCMGIRAQESPARAKKTPFQADKRASNGRRHVDLWYPIFDWTVEDVWACINASGVPHHPAYDQGIPRLSCSFCVLASKSALVRAAQLRPELAEEYRQVEVRIGHKFKADLSMADIIEAAARADREAPVEDWNA